MSGHSHWARVKHKKAASDAKKGQRFSKLVKEVTIAARDGSDKPEMNPRLRVAIERAREEGLPKENIERAIARAKGEGDAKALQEFLYEITAADGIMILVEGITDNKNRTLAEIRQILLRHNIRLADPGSVLWNFEKIGSLIVPTKENSAHAREEIELAVVDAGAEDFIPYGDGWIVETKLSALDAVRRAIETKGIIINDARPDFKARSPLSPEMSRREEIEQILEELGEHSDVQEIYSNITPLSH